MVSLELKESSLNHDQHFLKHKRFPFKSPVLGSDPALTW